MSCCSKKKSKNNIKHHLLLAIIGFSTVILSMFLMMLFASLSGVAAIIFTALWGISNSLVIFYIGWGSYSAVFRALWNKFFTKSCTNSPSNLFTADTLFVLSATTALLASTLHIIFPYLGIGFMYDAALIIFSFRHLGQYFTKSVERQINIDQSLRSIIAPSKVSINNNAIKTADLKQNQTFFLCAKDTILPVDSYALSSCEVNFKYINDQDRFVTVNSNKLLPAGTVINDNYNGGFSVIHSEATSYLAQSEQLLPNDSTFVAISVSWINAVMSYLIPVVLVVAISLGVGVGMLYTPVLGLQTAITLLTTICPCILGVIPGLMHKIALQRAQEIMGISFCNSAAFEQLIDIDGVVFDLNGTLTDNTPIAQRKEISTQEDDLNMIAALEQNSVHPVGKAIFESIKALCTVENISGLEVKKVRGGIEFVRESSRWLIGDACLMIRHNIKLTGNDTANSIYVYSQQANSGSFIKKGEFLLKHNLRKNATEVIKDLKSQGKDIYICTGADEATAKKYAGDLGIPESNVEFNQSNADKAAYIKKLQHGGKKITMIGNGLNDLSAITSSNMGFFLHTSNNDENNSIQNFCKSHAAATIDAACFAKIPSVFQLSQKTVINTKRLITANFIYNVLAISVCICLPFIGVPAIPVLGSASMCLQAVAISIYFYSLYKQLKYDISSLTTSSQLKR